MGLAVPYISVDPCCHRPTHPGRESRCKCSGLIFLPFSFPSLINGLSEHLLSFNHEADAAQEPGETGFRQMWADKWIMYHCDKGYRGNEERAEWPGLWRKANYHLSPWFLPAFVDVRERSQAFSWPCELIIAVVDRKASTLKVKSYVLDSGDI